MGMAMGGGGGGYGGVGDFYNTFVAPVKNVLSAFGYGTEKIIKSFYYFAKKILVNIPRLFNPLTPLIFDDIRDEEKAAYASLDQRYSETLKYLNEQLKNNDLKAVAFMLYPSQVLGAKLLQKGPKMGYNLVNTVTGGALARIKQAYDSLPAQERSRQRVAELIRQEQDASRSSSGRASSGRGYSLDEIVIRLTENQTEPEISSPAEFLKIVNNVNPEFISNAINEFSQAINPAGEEAINGIIKKVKGRVGEITSKVKATKNLDEFCEATNLNKNEILVEVKTQLEKELKTKIDEIEKKAKDEKKEPLTPQQKKELEEKLRPTISQQIENQIFNNLKNNFSNSESIKNFLNQIFLPLLDDKNVPKDTKTKINKLIQNP